MLFPAVFAIILDKPYSYEVNSENYVLLCSNDSSNCNKFLYTVVKVLNTTLRDAKESKYDNIIQVLQT